MSDLETLRGINAEYRKLAEDGSKLVKSAVLEAAQTILDRHPKVKSFSVHGYHPSFNDGEPCSFSFCSDVYKINSYCSPSYDDGSDDEDEDNKDRPTREDWSDGLEWTPDYKKQVKVAEPGWAALVNKDVGELFSIFTEDQMHKAFDSNFELIFTRGRGGKVKMESEYYDPGC
jgi:phage pi2 protein 07